MFLVTLTYANNLNHNFLLAKDLLGEIFKVLLKEKEKV